MRHAQTKTLFRYWMELFADANPPLRSAAASATAPIALPPRHAVEPAAIRDVLGDVFILDGSSGDARYRIAGTRVCALHGRELRGEPFAATFGTADRRSATSWTRSFGADRCLVLLSTAATSENGDVATLETLLLPLEHEGRPDLRALGITTPAPGGDWTTDWLGLVPIVSQEIRAARLIRPWEANPFLANAPFALPDTPGAARDRRTVHVPTGERRVEHLRVIEGGRA